MTREMFLKSCAVLGIAIIIPVESISLYVNRFDQDAENYIGAYNKRQAQLGSKPMTSDEEQSVRIFFFNMKKSGYWQSLDVLYTFDSPGPLINWINPQTI